MEDNSAYKLARRSKLEELPRSYYFNRFLPVEVNEIGLIIEKGRVIDAIEPPQKGIKRHSMGCFWGDGDKIAWTLSTATVYSPIGNVNIKLSDLNTKLNAKVILFFCINDAKEFYNNFLNTPYGWYDNDQLLRKINPQLLSYSETKLNALANQFAIDDLLHNPETTNSVEREYLMGIAKYLSPWGLTAKNVEIFFDSIDEKLSLEKEKESPRVNNDAGYYLNAILPFSGIGYIDRQQFMNLNSAFKESYNTGIEKLKEIIDNIEARLKDKKNPFIMKWQSYDTKSKIISIICLIFIFATFILRLPDSPVQDIFSKYGNYGAFGFTLLLFAVNSISQKFKSHIKEAQMSLSKEQVIYFQQHLQNLKDKLSTVPEPAKPGPTIGSKAEKTIALSGKEETIPPIPESTLELAKPAKEAENTASGGKKEPAPLLDKGKYSIEKMMKSTLYIFCQDYYLGGYKKHPAEHQDFQTKPLYDFFCCDKYKSFSSPLLDEVIEEFKKQAPAPDDVLKIILEGEQASQWKTIVEEIYPNIDVESSYQKKYVKPMQVAFLIDGNLKQDSLQILIKHLDSILAHFMNKIPEIRFSLGVYGDYRSEDDYFHSALNKQDAKYLVWPENFNFLLYDTVRTLIGKVKSSESWHEAGCLEYGLKMMNNLSWDPEHHDCRLYIIGSRPPHTPTNALRKPAFGEYRDELTKKGVKILLRYINQDTPGDDHKIIEIWKGLGPGSVYKQVNINGAWEEFL